MSDCNLPCSWQRAIQFVRWSSCTKVSPGVLPWLLRLKSKRPGVQQQYSCMYLCSFDINACSRAWLAAAEQGLLKLVHASKAANAELSCNSRPECNMLDRIVADATVCAVYCSECRHLTRTWPRCTSAEARSASCGQLMMPTLVSDAPKMLHHDCTIMCETMKLMDSCVLDRAQASA